MSNLPSDQYRHTSFYYASQMLHFFFFFNKWKARPSTSKNITTCFIVVLTSLLWSGIKPTVSQRYACKLPCGMKVSAPSFVAVCFLKTMNPKMQFRGQNDEPSLPLRVADSHAPCPSFRSQLQCHELKKPPHRRGSAVLPPVVSSVGLHITFNLCIACLIALICLKV